MQDREFLTKEFAENHSVPIPSHPNFNCKIGNRYGSLYVIKYAWFKNEHCYICKCDCGKYLVKRTGNLNNKLYRSCGCKINSSKRLDIEEMISRVKSRTDDEIIEANIMQTSKWKLQCKIHGTYSVKFSSIKKDFPGCPICSKRGYNPKLPANFYILAISDNSGIIAYKYGITNKNVNSRRKQIMHNSKLTSEIIFEFNSNDGYFIRDFESLVKNLIPSKYLDTNQLYSGYTETIHPIFIVNLANLVKYILK